MGATDTAATVDAGVEPSLVDTIKNIEEGDLLVVNGTSRTWDVTDVANRTIEGPNDARESKRVCRLSCGESVLGLELVAYPDHYTASLHAPAVEDWTEESQSFDVHDVTILSQDIPWVVVTGGADKYHFPDPQAAAFGEARPACGGGNQSATYRIVRSNTVRPTYAGCKDCLRREKPVALDHVTCPSCSRSICHGILRGSAVGAVDGLSITCPHCDFDGVINVDVASGFAGVDDPTT
ncbi:hypothetical protein G9463_10120 [Haloarcula sp. JP-Z28]|uniref:Uncharacterized protein n=1 Tax=Haloarcula marismortui ATCC 33800 TaxID=662476 RepID=M0JP48_9EURY|nr:MULTISPECIES: hypothetical protein [Haloarcula]EMA09749.1 hypothetical protein C436_18816 [Haloarcula sinaiiensis ATCC 33800]NHN63653.1 hypothetical protein [Haloarcula sp. JP-Z28]QUJ74701.1 hypothetical protein KDQ40_21070 [Haloarcula sinaiiensis ATCC 33800]